MIIWRSWGILGILIPGLLGGAMYGINETGLFFGLGALLGSVIAFALGWYLNQMRPVTQLAQWETERRAYLDRLVTAGVFRIDEQTPPPTSMAEAKAQADYLFEQEKPQVRKNLFNRSTIFFIPMQWFAILTAGVGLFVIISS